MMRVSAWKQKYSKQYNTAEEDQNRFEVFKANVAEYARRNAEPGQTATYAPDMFSDMTRAEFSAASAIIEGALIHATGVKEWVSPQNMLDCANYNFGNFGSNYDGCQGYRVDSMLSEIAEKGDRGGGVMFEKNYQYQGSMRSCRHSLSSKGDVTVDKYFSERMNENEGSSLYSRLMQYGPMGVAFNSGNLNGYSGGIVRHSNNCRYTQSGYDGSDHAVTLVGWGVQNGVKYWVIKNSWGANWGEAKDAKSGGSPQGYFRIQRGVGACHLAEEAAIGVTVAGTKPDPTPTSTSDNDPNPDPDDPRPCTPKSKSKACGTRKCGAVDNGCGNPITCGYCSEGQACSSAGKCGKVSDEADWAQVSPSGGQDFSISKSAEGVIIETSSATDEEKRVMWKSSSQWMNDMWTSFSVSVKADGPGIMGIGMRMGQPDGDLNGISWKLSIPESDGGSTTVSLLRCFFYGSDDQCASMAQFEMETNAYSNFTINFAMQGSGTIAMRPYLNGRALMGSHYYWIGRSYFPNVGSAFLVASGSGKHFQYPKLRTRSTVKVAMKSCHTTDEWTAEVARILKVPRDFIVDVQGQQKSGSSCRSNQFDNFNITLLDSNMTVGLVAQATLPIVTGVDQFMFSNALAEQLTETVAGGGLENMGIMGATAETVAPALAEAAIADTIVAAAGAALSAGAIVGIAVGGGAALAVVAAGVGIGVYAATRPEPTEPIPDDFQPKNPLRKTFFKVKASHGVDVMSNTTQHQSITGRAPPVSV
eukprot:m51a1_g3570 hypothetical protein (758) ;mRNA; r:1093748-1096396